MQGGAHMKGSAEVIRQLNEVLTGEVTAVNQYFLHASMCKNWGYLRLYKQIYEESLEEMRHAQRLIDRILFLEGMPALHHPLSVQVGQNLKEMLERDLQLETSTLPPLHQGVTLCLEQGDTGTRELLEHLIVEGEHHTEWLETQLHLIHTVGLENYAAQQIQLE
jgi:bacterioferritin